MVAVFSDVCQYVSIPLIEIGRDNRIAPLVGVGFMTTSEHGYAPVSLLRRIEKADIAVHRVCEDDEAGE